MTSMPSPHLPSGPTVALGIFAIVGVCLFDPAPAAAQMSGTYGADRGSCDRSGLQSILSPSKGNIIGSLGGAALGGIVGNQFGSGSGKGLLTAVGVVGGALARRHVARPTDPPDHARLRPTP